VIVVRIVQAIFRHASILCLGAALLMVGKPAHACEETAALPESLQVAWISPLTQTVKDQEWIEVVRVRDLRGWIRTQGIDATGGERVLQAPGMLQRGEAAIAGDYKITIFDVQRSWLCRPVTDITPDTEINGVGACETSQQSPLTRKVSPGFTGCGYSLDTHASVRGLDVYRIQWASASSWGFCVLPLDRFLTGA